LRWVMEYRMANGEAISEDDQLMAALNRVRSEMERRPRPDANEVARASASARAALADWFDGQPGVHERFHFRSDRLGLVIADAAGRAETFRSWESAVQFYLALVAARESWPGGWNGPMREVTNQMQYGLQYPQMIDISRYAKRVRAKGPQANRIQITAMGIELASSFGPVTADPMVIADVNDPAEIRRQLDQMIEEVTQDWTEARKIREESNPLAEPVTELATPDSPTKPPVRRPKTAEELLQELQKAPNEPQDSDE
ncbi:MAG: hypothetical protein VYA84_10330, partial [Planctomycetota bacterium]|nr:hypothetical protein [Planctomycetota bacterium]